MIRNQDIRKDGESTGCGFAGNNREEFLVSGPRSGNSKAKMPMRTTGGNWQTSARYYPPRRWRLPDSLRNVFRIGFGRIGTTPAACPPAVLVYVANLLLMSRLTSRRFRIGFWHGPARWEASPGNRWIWSILVGSSYIRFPSCQTPRRSACRELGKLNSKMTGYSYKNSRRRDRRNF